MSVFIFPPTAALLRIAPFGYSSNSTLTRLGAPLFAMYGRLIGKVQGDLLRARFFGMIGGGRLSHQVRSPPCFCEVGNHQANKIITKSYKQP